MSKTAAEFAKRGVEPQFSYSQILLQADAAQKRDPLIPITNANGKSPDLDQNLSLAYINKTWKTRQKRPRSSSISGDLDKAVAHPLVDRGQLSLFKVLHQIILVLSDFDAGCTNIQRVVGNQHRHEFKKFTEWL